MSDVNATAFDIKGLVRETIKPVEDSLHRAREG
jgi:hypothetical protein